VNPDATDMPVRAFGTFTHDLHDLADWFKSHGVTSIAMESTGVYWIPAYEILEQHGFEVILVNARYAKNVPGRKPDVSDASWLRQLHSYGLLRGSFRPSAQNVVLIGGPGTGETHVATALGAQVVEHHRRKVRFFSTIELVNTLEQEKAKGKAGRLAERLVSLDLVVLPSRQIATQSPAG